MLIFPIRHHSPTAALQLERLIRERRPRAVLVEGPSDATPLIPLLLDAGTVPPVALYAFRRHGDDVRAAYYPFCQYSPEYVALRVGHEVAADLRFCDLPAAVSLDAQRPDGDGDNAEPEAASDEPGSDEPAPDEPAPPDYEAFSHALTQSAGLDSFEELWEAAFEQDAGEQRADGYVSLLTEFGGVARQFTIQARDRHDLRRERHMAATAHAIITAGTPSETVLLVCGAAHLAGIEAEYAALAGMAGSDGTANADPTVSGQAPSTEPAEIALIPFSFPRLSEQSGYGAGNRAPWYYQQVWEQRGDYGAATRYALAALGRHLRCQGHVASLAQSIDAYSLAVVLAAMRDKRAPGVDEMAEAAVACFGQGNVDLVSSALQEVLIGEAVGTITHLVGRTPLQREFYAQAQRLKLPILDSARQVLVHPVVPLEAEQSIFLHRLTIAGVPYARELQSGLRGGGRAAQGGPLESLGRALEKWELQWSPATDARLIERTAWGSTLVEVCGRLLRQELEQAGRIDDGTQALLRLALCDLGEQRFDQALERCETLAADSGSFAPLARATYQLDGLLAFGAARRMPQARLGQLASRMFTRAALHLPASARCGDEAALEIQRALGSLFDLVQRKSAVVGDTVGFWEAVESVAESPSSHASLRGLSFVLLELAGRLSQGELAARLRFWLSAVSDAGENARLVAGLFSLHRGTLVRNQALIGAVTDFLLELEIEQLTPLLPVLRRGLGDLSGSERAYVSETLARELGLEAGLASRALALSSTDEARLREADAAVAATLLEWETRYGILARPR